MDDPTQTPEPAGASKPKRRPRETRELKVKYEIVVIDGEEGRKLHQIQAQAVVEALLWLANNPKPTDDDQPDRSNHRRRARHDDEQSRSRPASSAVAREVDG